EALNIEEFTLISPGGALILFSWSAITPKSHQIATYDGAGAAGNGMGSSTILARGWNLMKDSNDRSMIRDHSEPGGQGRTV
ncbi:MAG: hypothetical protein WEB62_03125, partial [Bacteroidota bacterium]